jgi:hypothetical protein
MYSLGYPIYGMATSNRATIFQPPVGRAEGKSWLDEGHFCPNVFLHKGLRMNQVLSQHNAVEHSSPPLSHSLTPSSPNTHHSTDHDDFRPNVFLHKEGLHEAQEVHAERDAVEHARPHKVLAVESIAQDDGDEEEEVHHLVELVPHRRQVA